MQEVSNTDENRGSDLGTSKDTTSKDTMDDNGNLLGNPLVGGEGPV